MAKKSKGKKKKKERQKLGKKISNSNVDDEQRSVRMRGEKLESKINEEETAENLRFQDPFEDEYEEEQIPEEEMMVDADNDAEYEGKISEQEGVEEEKITKQVWRPGIDTLEEGEQLDYDPSAYIMLHSIQPEWPCLSFDLMKDNLGDNRSRFPLTMFACCGTQADRADKNKITLLKMSDLHKTQVKEDDDEESEDSNTEDDPVLDHCHIAHPTGGVNRIRSMPQHPGIVATWSDGGKAFIWDLTAPFSLLEGGKPGPRSHTLPPVSTFEGHPQEGWAMDWSQKKTGRLLTGDCSGFIYLWEPSPGGAWGVDKVPFSGHKGSVEDLQWSPSEESVFMSAGVDRTVQVWDVRKKGSSMISCDAHEADVNVISWNRNVSYLVVSGSDDGSFKIWDLRQFGRGDPVAHFKWHRGPITSVEWHPTDESCLAVAGADEQLTIWDLSVEADDAEGRAQPPMAGEEEFPAQLLFIHQGQTDIKELHFHPQIPGTIMSTALDGFNVFKPATNI